MPTRSTTKASSINPTRKPKNSIALALHGTYADHELKIATRGPTAGKPKRVKPDANRQATPVQIINAYEAWRFAEARGWRLNTWITVIFDQLHGRKGWKPGKPPGDQVAFQRKRLMQSLADWCDPRHIPLAWVSVIENIPGRGPHAHILMHLPEDAPAKIIVQEGEIRVSDPKWEGYRTKLYARLRTFSKWTQAELDAAPSGIRPIDVSVRHLPTSGSDDNALAKLRYIAKSASPDLIVDYKGERRIILELLADDGGREAVTLKPSTDTYTRRMLTSSRQISVAARRATGWTDGSSAFTWMSRKIERADRLAAVMEALQATTVS